MGRRGVLSAFLPPRLRRTHTFLKGSFGGALAIIWFHTYLVQKGKQGTQWRNYLAVGFVADYLEDLVYLNLLHAVTQGPRLPLLGGSAIH